MRYSLWPLLSVHLLKDNSWLSLLPSFHFRYIHTYSSCLLANRGRDMCIVEVGRYRVYRYRYNINVCDPKYWQYRYPLLQCSLLCSYISFSPAMSVLFLNFRFWLEIVMDVNGQLCCRWTNDMELVPKQFTRAGHANWLFSYRHSYIVAYRLPQGTGGGIQVVQDIPG